MPARDAPEDARCVYFFTYAVAATLFANVSALRSFDLDTYGRARSILEVGARQAVLGETSVPEACWDGKSGQPHCHA